ncbi:TPA: hypothetical protein I7151_22310 [Vibrio vulnificus]|nr:hypothetical protein [Vibrio vulnificus]HAT8493238.1 hypothetical protein [Vibrio vulnificus]HAU8285676.1 hypothetical protein [Vibrio vulnificus]HAU8299944.1 hypothetical protein [Vibrio vulnificus]
MIPNARHFWCHRWVSCLRWYSLGWVVALLTP